MDKQPIFFCVCSQKGGVGKSTFTILLASWLHYALGRDVLVVDCDAPQWSIVAQRERELDVLERGLEAAVRWLNPGGRVCVISYHSLEDRIVKQHFQELSKGCTCPPDIPVCVCGNVPIVKVTTRKPLVATAEEVARNPRARSAKIRCAERL